MVLDMKNMKMELKEKIKKYSNKKYFEGYIKNEFLTNDGDADIYIRLKNKEDLFDERTSEKQLELRKEFYDYIDDKTSILDNDIQINLHIKGLDISEREQGRARHIIKEHYAIELYKIQKEYQIHKNKIIKLFCLGFLCLLIYGLFYYFTKSKFLLEVFSFLFSFSLWQAFEKLIYTLNTIKNNRDAAAQKLLINVEFFNQK